MAGPTSVRHSEYAEAVTSKASAPVIGFDLDMTLIDSRPGIAATYELLAAQTATRIDTAMVVSRLGPPVEVELAHWYASDQLADAAQRYRALYPGAAIEPVEVMPGAHEALAAVRRQRGRSVLVTAKHGPNAVLHVDHLGLDVDSVHGDVWREGKAAALLAELATMYVGDHVDDVEAARTCGVVGIAVTSGSSSRKALAAAGADVVLDSLEQFPGWLDEHLLTTRVDDLAASLAGLGSLLVAFSGGADSAFLLTAAVRALGSDKVMAATAYSDSLPLAERGPAAAFCAALGVRQLRPRTDEMTRPGYAANDGDRCYFCKSELLDVLAPLARAAGLAAVATGTNADDAVAGFRPGIRAAAERGALTPLRDAGLSKAQVREASRRWGLPTWDKPAAACLSSRVAYGVAITPHRLARVERAEAAVRAALAADGIEVVNLRVRDLGERARVEVDAGAVGRVAECAGVHDAVREAGFDDVEVDTRGFRSGSLNELLPQPGAAQVAVTAVR